MMDNAFSWDMHAVLKHLHEAELMSLRFLCIGKVLMIDLRPDEREGPIIVVDGLSGNARERVRRMERLRPGSPVPDNVTIAQWPGSVRGWSLLGRWKNCGSELSVPGSPRGVSG